MIHEGCHRFVWS